MTPEVETKVITMNLMEVEEEREERGGVKFEANQIMTCDML